MITLCHQYFITANPRCSRLEWTRKKIYVYNKFYANATNCVHVCVDQQTRYRIFAVIILPHDDDDDRNKVIMLC